MFIIILILCLFVAVLIYGFFTIRKLNRQIEEFQNQADRIDDLSAKVNTITSKIDCLAIGNEDTQEKHFDIDSNSFMSMNNFNNRYFHRQPDETTDDNTQENNIVNIKKEEIKLEKENKPEINEQPEESKEKNNEPKEKPEEKTEEKPEDKPVEDTKSNDSINFKKIIDLENNDIKNFEIEVDNEEPNKINEPIQENDQDFFLESKEDDQPDMSDNQNGDIPEEHLDDQPDDDDDTDASEPESNDEANNEVSIDYANVKKFIETHPLNKIRVPAMKDFIVNNKIDLIIPGITGMKREEMYNKLKELIKDK